MSKVNIAVGDLIRQRFLLEKELGRGGMGRVFKALDRIRQEAQDREPYVAIKILDESLQSQPIFFMGMQREAKKAQKLNHPNIVRVYDFDRDGQHIFLVMEYLAGKSLDDVIAQGKSANLSLGKILFIIRSVAAALEFAHKHGIVHLDLKPKNIFLTDEGQVKVIDFGIARAIKNPKVPADDKTVFDPRTLGALSPSYASPQMIDGVDPDARDDIFSLGCVAYELIAGRHPFDRVPATRARAEGREPVRPAGISNRQWAGLKRALSFDRKVRTSSIADFIADLSAGERSLPRLPLLIAAGALGLLLLAGGGYLLWPSHHQQPATPAPSSGLPPDGSADVVMPPKGGNAVLIPPPAPTPAPAPVSPVPISPQPPPRADMAAVIRMLSDVPCARLRAVDRDGTVAIQGYSGDTDSFTRTLASLSQQWRVPFNADQVGSLDRQYCGPLELFQPYVQANSDGRLRLTLFGGGGETPLREGDALVLTVTAPDEGSSLYVDYWSLDGNVVHMFPNPTYRAGRLSAAGEITLGDGGSGGQWLIGKPFGTEMITALATSSPLFSNLRPEVEPAQTYLADLRKALAKRAKQRPSAPPLAAVSFIRTERGQ